ncbi:Hypothetical protein D9617_21g096250 [Elsinoe fawcettii]|nr:Hypothetical protein D9617_21g096250 [Elsinoe fawcettii]
MRATTLLSAALVGLVAASPATLPQDLDFAQLAAAPTVASGPTPGALDQKVEVASQVEVQAAATAGASRSLLRRDWGVLPGYNNSWFCLIYKTCTTTSAAPAKTTKSKAPKKTTTKHVAKTTPLQKYVVTTRKSKSKKTTTTVKKTKAPKKTTIATTSKKVTKKPKSTPVIKPTAVKPVKTTKSRKPKTTPSWASPIQRHTTSVKPVSPIIRHTTSTSSPTPVIPIQRQTTVSTLAPVSPEMKAHSTTTSIPGYGGYIPIIGYGSLSSTGSSVSSRTSTISTTGSSTTSIILSSVSPVLSSSTTSSIILTTASTTRSTTASTAIVTTASTTASTSPSTTPATTAVTTISTTRSTTTSTTSTTTIATTSTAAPTTAQATTSTTSSTTSSTTISTTGAATTSSISTTTSTTADATTSSTGAATTASTVSSVSPVLTSSTTSTTTTTGASTTSSTTSVIVTTSTANAITSSTVFTTSDCTTTTSAFSATSSSTTTGPSTPVDSCAPQAGGKGPKVTPDTASDFLKYAPFHSMASAAPTSIGSTEGATYLQVFRDLDASVSAASYLGLHTLDSYDATVCGKYCDNNKLCTSFNIFVERSPVHGIADSCPNADSQTEIKCTLWGSKITNAQATNKGQKRHEFEVVITASNGYDKTGSYTPHVDPPVYNAPVGYAAATPSAVISTSALAPYATSSTATTLSTRVSPTTSSTSSSYPTLDSDSDYDSDSDSDDEDDSYSSHRSTRNRGTPQSKKGHWSAPIDAHTSAASSPSTFLGTHFIPGPFNAQLCADYAVAQTKVNAATALGSAKTSAYDEAKYVNAYYLHKNGQPFGTVCALYTQKVGEEKMTYHGGVQGGVKYEVVQSWGFEWVEE